MAKTFSNVPKFCFANLNCGSELGREAGRGADLGGGCRGCTLRIHFKICLPQQSVTPFLSGTPPPKKRPGSTSGEGGGGERVGKVR